MARVDFTYDYSSMGNYLRSSAELQSAALAFAKDAAAMAKSMAPTGPVKRGAQPPGEFRGSIQAEPSRTRRGDIGARVVAAPAWAEFGRRRRRPYQGAQVLARTRRALSAPRRTA